MKGQKRAKTGAAVPCSLNMVSQAAEQGGQTCIAANNVVMSSDILVTCHTSGCTETTGHTAQSCPALRSQCHAQRGQTV